MLTSFRLRVRFHWSTFAFLGAAALLPAAPAPAQGLTAPLTVAASLRGATPIGVTVSRGGRIFMSFPRSFDVGPYCVAEIKNGRPVAYPSRQANALKFSVLRAKRLVSVQGLTVDARDRLWLLDSGQVKNDEVSFGGAKLVSVNLKTNKVSQIIYFPFEVAGPDAYLNDVRVDLSLGKAGTAFITDSSEKAANGLVVVDLASGKSFRRLNSHPSVTASPTYVPTVEGYPLLKRAKNGKVTHDQTGVDGLALGPGGKYLYYCPNIGTHLYRIPTATLANQSLTDAQVAAAVEDLGDKGFASDGIAADRAGYIYLSDYEHNAVRRVRPTGPGSLKSRMQLVTHDPKLIWPDSIAFRNGDMYVTADQLNRLPKYHRGKDLRQKPILLFRKAIGAQPVAL